MPVHDLPLFDATLGGLLSLPVAFDAISFQTGVLSVYRLVQFAEADMGCGH